MTKQIPLSQQKRRNSKNTGLIALVSDEDYETLCQWNWSAISTHRLNGGYAMRRDNHSGKTILMHREVLQAPAGIEVDHIIVRIAAKGATIKPATKALLSIRNQENGLCR